MIKNTFLFLLAVALCGSSKAQLPNLPIHLDSMFSSILKEERRLEIVLPDGYDPTNGKETGVIYVTDGEWNTRIVVDIQQFLGIQFIPPHIIVGIDDAPRGKGNLRYRDLTPTRNPNEKGTPMSGGGEAFLSFITKELMPYINSKYANNGRNILFGHSLGGLFGMYALLKEPKSFTGYLLADPSFWWDHNSMAEMAREGLRSLSDTARYVLITGRSGQPFEGMGIEAMDSVLQQLAPANLHWKSMAYSDETHNSMPFRTMYDGLKYIYWGYFAGRNLGFHPDNGFIVKGKPITVHSFNENFADIFYSTDGTEPTRSSTPLSWNGEIALDSAANLCVKAICNQPEYSRTLKGTFVQVERSFPAVGLPKHMEPGGLHYAYYALKDTTDLAHARAVYTGRVDSSFEPDKVDYPGQYLCVFTGYVRVAEAGYYLLGSGSQGTTRIYVGKQLVIDQPGKDRDYFKASIIPFDSGYYAIRIEHQPNAGQGDQHLKLLFVNPDGVARDEGPRPVPWQELYSEAKK